MGKLDNDLLNTKMELLKTDVSEAQIYIEAVSITLLFIMISLLNLNSIKQIMFQKTAIGYIIVVSIILLIILMIYMFLNIYFTIYKRMKKIKNQKRILLRNWIDKDKEGTYYL